MGYIRHDAVVILVADYDRQGKAIAALRAFIKNVPERAKELLGMDAWDNPKRFAGLFGEFEAVVNGNPTTFFMAPDGSKEGWNDSDVADTLREEFIQTAKENSEYASILHVSGFGGDDNELDVPYSTCDRMGRFQNPGKNAPGIGHT